MPSKTIRTAGAELIVDDIGSDDPVLVFLHYWGGSARTWTPVIERLPTSFRSVAINQRGWGGSRSMDGRYDLDALADDVLAVVAALGIGRSVLVGHSMGGKVAQIVAARRPAELAGLVLVAPAPPSPMPVPPEVRAGMLESYQSREGVLEALKVLGGSALRETYREQIIEDTLRGDPAAKRYWPEQGMTADIGAAIHGLSLPVEILVGADDQVEQPSVLRSIFSQRMPQANFTVVPETGHLLPLAAPQAVADGCVRLRNALNEGSSRAARTSS